MANHELCHTTDDVTHRSRHMLSGISLTSQSCFMEVQSSATTRTTAVRCAFFDWGLYSRMPMVPTPARLKFLHACDVINGIPLAHSLLSPLTGWHYDSVQTLRATLAASNAGWLTMNSADDFTHH